MVVTVRAGLPGEVVDPDEEVGFLARTIGKIEPDTVAGIALDEAVVGATPIAGSTSLSGKGLVGKVIEVTAHSAKVQLITDSESSVAATIEGPRAEGIVQGSASGKITMEYVDRDQNVDPKLVIVTSGFGGVYPKGIPVGIVASEGGEDVNIYKQIEVQAFVDFRVLEEVMVITSTTGTGLAGITGTTDSSTTTSTTNTPATTVTTVTTILPSNTSTTKGQ